MGVFPTLTAEDDDAAEDGRTLALSSRAPFCREEVELDGESWEEKEVRSLVRETRCWEGSLALIASTKALAA